MSMFLQIKYKTRGMVSPQGKPKVYFCCHPEDFEIYFESVSDELLEKQNCSVWYRVREKQDWDAETEREAMRESLKEMQLFVMPVTEKMLRNPDATLDWEYELAVEQHIPVLPLLQEPGLADLFGNKYGDLQYLDKTHHDPTAISYEEKLERYLSSVLIGDALAAQIRAAFDAYVFLSYRKKDRKYAKQLMELIHKNDFCRDIAIWYDEFLVPGEDFNGAIQAALKKSDLFVLTVTPNLVNEDNYIMEIEYPLAQAEEKYILPAELVATDKTELAKKFKDIPECTNAKDEAELSEALLTAVKKLAIEQNDDSPEHNFFIGLAYLGGVDVEVNYDRALTLIEFAANAGVAAACEKLVSMYETGMGVKRDYDKGIKWREKLLDFRRDIYKKEPSSENRMDLILALVFLGDACKKQNQIDKAEAAYLQILTLCEDNMESEAAFELKEWTVIASNRLYLTANYSHRFKEAVLYIEKAAFLAEEIYDKDEFILAAYYSNLADAYSNTGKFNRAEIYVRKSLTVYENCKREDYDAKIGAARAYNIYGIIKYTTQEQEQACTLYEKAIELTRKVNQETKNAYVEEYALYIANLALAKMDLGRFAEARQDLQTAKEWICAILEDQGCNNLYGKMAMIENLLGRTCDELGEYDRAEEHFKKSLKCLEGFEKLYAPDMALVYNNLGTIYLARKKYSLAAENMEKSYQIYSQLTAQESHYNGMLALLSFNLANCCCRQRQYKKAEEYGLKSVAIYKNLVEKGMMTFQKHYQNAMGTVVEIYLKSGHWIKAVKYFVKCVEENLK